MVSYNFLRLISIATTVSAFIVTPHNGSQRQMQKQRTQLLPTTDVCDRYRKITHITYLSSSSNMDDGEGSDDDGAQLAAAFFRTAQSKGINIDPNELLDDDDEEDDDDDDKLTQSSISASQDSTSSEGSIDDDQKFASGNAGAASFTNDQLYSEVKERVLESAGGFLSFVQGATDDDDEDDDEHERDSMELLSSADTDKPYVVPTTVPDSELTAGEVVLLVLEALRNNNNPTTNKGVEILFGYSSPGSQIKNEVGLTPNEYAEFLQETEYKVLFTNNGPIHIDKADYSFDGKKAFFTARLQQGSSPLDTVSVNFILSTTGREDDACWLIDSILIRPESMRRRRRK